MNLAPSTSGNMTVAIPAAKSNVIPNIFDRALKTEPRYAGNIRVMQHGANNITMPPKKATIRDALLNKEFIVEGSGIMFIVLLCVKMFLHGLDDIF